MNSRTGFKTTKNHQFTFATQFSIDVSMLPLNFQMEYVELQSDIQLKNVIMSLYQTPVSPLLAERNIPHFTVTPHSCHRFWQYAHL